MKKDKIIWNTDFPYCHITSESPTSLASIDFTAGIITFHRSCSKSEVQQILLHYDDMSKAVSRSEEPPF